MPHECVEHARDCSSYVDFLSLAPASISRLRGRPRTGNTTTRTRSHHRVGSSPVPIVSVAPTYPSSAVAVRTIAEHAPDLALPLANLASLGRFVAALALGAFVVPSHGVDLPVDPAPIQTPDLVDDYAHQSEVAPPTNGYAPSSGAVRATAGVHASVGRSTRLVSSLRSPLRIDQSRPTLTGPSPIKASPRSEWRTPGGPAINRIQKVGVNGSRI
jgi:hypothetical protein